MSRLLTSRGVENFKPAPSRREIPDKRLPGLYLIVQPSGARGWAVRYRIGGRSRKHTLGGYPAVDLKSARELGAKALRAVAEGRDPGREKALANAIRPDTIASVAEQFIELHCKRTNRARTIANTRNLLDKHVLSRWRHRPFTDIRRRDVRDLLDAIVAGGSPVAANRVLTVLKTMFGWAIARDLVESSPCVGVKAPTQEQPRDRVLSDTEIAAVWHAVGALSMPYQTLVKLLILTGQRRDEIARMAWGELDFEGHALKLPRERCKNNRAHEVPLSEPALAILRGLPRLGGTFVLTFDGKKPANNHTREWKRLMALLPVDTPPWCLHDLRRTVASGMARIGVSLPVIEKVLNHSSGSFAGIVGVYQHHNFADEKRDALDRWGSHVKLVGGA